MKFFFDESGDFTLHDPSKDKYAVVAGVAFPETEAPTLEHAYANFLSCLSTTERKNGEPKGALLRPDSRRQFADFLGSFQDVIAFVVILDLKASRNEIIAGLPEGMRDALLQQSERCIHESMRASVELLAKQVANLSSEQFSRLFTLGQAIIGTLNAANIHYLDAHHATNYEIMSFELDQVANREKIVFDILLRLWIPTWTHHEPLILVEGVHDVPGHPLTTKYGSAEEIVGKKLVSDNLTFVDSRNCVGVQMADIIANTVYQSANNQESGPHDVAAKMIANAHRFPWAAIRFFCFGERGGQVRTGGLHRLINAIEQQTGQMYDPAR